MRLARRSVDVWQGGLVRLPWVDDEQDRWRPSGRGVLARDGMVNVARNAGGLASALDSLTDSPQVHEVSRRARGGRRGDGAPARGLNRRSRLALWWSASPTTAMVRRMATNPQGGAARRWRGGVTVRACGPSPGRAGLLRHSDRATRISAWWAAMPRACLLLRHGRRRHHLRAGVLRTRFAAEASSTRQAPSRRRWSVLLTCLAGGGSRPWGSRSLPWPGRLSRVLDSARQWARHTTLVLARIEAVPAARADRKPDRRRRWSRGAAATDRRVTWRFGAARVGQEDPLASIRTPRGEASQHWCRPWRSAAALASRLALPGAGPLTDCAVAYKRLEATADLEEHRAHGGDGHHRQPRPGGIEGTGRIGST
jgi:hypothetical protein